MKFEWDEAKERLNISMHGLNFGTAAKIFLDPYLLASPDVGHDDESRWNVLGMVNSRVLFVTYTERGDRIRIISARGAEPHERRRYYHSV